MVGTDTDVTERKLTQEALRQTEKLNRSIIESSTDCIKVLDMEARLVYMNPGGKKLLEICDFDEYLNAYWPDFWKGEDRHTALRAMALAKAGGTGTFQGYCPTMGGAPRWWDVAITPITDTEGNVSQLLVVSRDITQSKLAEEALRRSEERLHRAQSAARVGTWEWNLKTGESTWSEEIYELLGLERGDGNARLGDFVEFIHPEDRERALGKVESVIRGGENYYNEFRIIRRDGAVLWLAAQGRVVRGDSGSAEWLMGVNIDITERKLAEEAARQVEQRNQDILHALPDMMFVQTVDGDFIDYYANDTRKLLVPPEEFLGKNVRDLMPPELAEAFLRCFRRAKETGEVQVYEYTLPIEGGGRSYEARIIYTNSDQYLSIVRDITERKRVEAQLIESEELFRNMADTAPVLIWVNGLEGCEFVNRSYLVFLGVGEEEVRKYDWARFIHPGDRDSYLNAYHDALAARKLFEARFRFLRADGEYRWMKTIGLPRQTATGDFLGYVGSTFDITDAKQSEEAMKEAFAQLSELKTQLEAEIIYLREELKLDHDFGEIVGESEAIRNVFYKIEQVSPTNTTVLILGETGTGKELVARAIHRTSMRKDKPLIKVNCATLPPTLIESELFGHEKGAFTGATARQLGRFEMASGGTIFLDEIGDLPLELQGKLLRVLQEGEFERLGSGKTIKVNVRVIAATNRNLPGEVQKGVFREDLWYRLNVFPLTVPPLRERTEDIPLLVEAFARKFSKELGKPIKAISPAALKALQDYSWPGNIRELANVIERAIINTEGEILRLADQLNRPRATEIPPLQQTLIELERQYILRILEETGWRIEGPKGAARILGLNPSTLRTRMAKLGIQKSKSTSQ
jgi:PAS domain S-box-containing protein